MISGSANLVIITVHSGPIIFLKKTLQSIDTQTVAPHHNIVVAKGISVYHTKYLQNNNRTFVINKDKSIYSAMNIALQNKIIKNKFIIFLNSGDSFFNKRIIFDIKKFFLTNNVLVGKQVLRIDNDSYHIRKYFYLKKKYSPHGSFLCHANILSCPTQKILFDEKHIIDADGLWMSRVVAKNKHRFKKININISTLSLGGVSTNPTIKTILHYFKINLNLFIKETLKFIINVFLTKKIYYRIIYCVKYKYFKKN